MVRPWKPGEIWILRKRTIMWDFLRLVMYLESTFLPWHAFVNCASSDCQHQSIWSPQAQVFRGGRLPNQHSLQDMVSQPQDIDWTIHIRGSRPNAHVGETTPPKSTAMSHDTIEIDPHSTTTTYHHGGQTTWQPQVGYVDNCNRIPLAN